MGIPDLPVQLSIISRFSTLLGPQCHINTAIPSLHLSLSLPLSLLPSFHTGTIARTMPGCHHIKRQRGSERELEGQTERDRELQCGSKSDCASKQNWGEKLPFKLIIYPWEEKPQCLSLPECVALSLCLCLSHGANCLHATSVYFYTLLSKPFLWDEIQHSARFSTCLCSSSLALLTPHTPECPKPVKMFRFCILQMTRLAVLKG